MSPPILTADVRIFDIASHFIEAHQTEPLIDEVLRLTGRPQLIAKAMLDKARHEGLVSVTPLGYPDRPDLPRHSKGFVAPLDDATAERDKIDPPPDMRRMDFLLEKYAEYDKLKWANGPNSQIEEAMYPPLSEKPKSSFWIATRLDAWMLFLFGAVTQWGDYKRVNDMMVAANKFKLDYDNAPDHRDEISLLFPLTFAPFQNPFRLRRLLETLCLPTQIKIPYHKPLGVEP